MTAARYERPIRTRGNQKSWGWWAATLLSFDTSLDIEKQAKQVKKE
jgi:hypothetical protein